MPHQTAEAPSSSAPRQPSPSHNTSDSISRSSSSASIFRETKNHKTEEHVDLDAAWDQDPEDDDMPSDLRPSLHRPSDGRSSQPLLGSSRKGENGYHVSQENPGMVRRKSTFRERDPDTMPKESNNRRYTYAAFFLAVSLVSFTVQTETAVYISTTLGWKKSYAMLYFTHGSWSMLWFLQLAIIRVQKWNTPWDVFWRRHVQILWQTAQMVQHRDVNAPTRFSNVSPIPYILKTIAFVTCFLTIAGGSWYVAVSMTTPSDLTAIYNCNAFFAYAFSVPLLKEKLKWPKVLAVVVACIGVFTVAYGDTDSKHSSHSGGGIGGPGDEGDEPPQDRAIGNIIIGVGSVLYGLYEVLYKKYACPPEDTSPGRSMIFANFIGTLIGLFTLTVLWIPIPILHVLDIERFELPHGEAAWMLLISVFSNAIFSGSFLVLISLTSPVLSAVAALLTIFIVAIVSQLLPPPLYTKLSVAAIIGGLLIIAAFIVLAWTTFQEMKEERRKKAELEGMDDSDNEA